MRLHIKQEAGGHHWGSGELRVSAESCHSFLRSDDSPCRYEALETRLEALRAERRSAAGAPLETVARHAAEVESLVVQIARLQVH